MAAKLKRGDRVVVLSGNDRGKEGEIQSVDPKSGKARVSGINVAVRHVRQTQTEAGGRQAREMPVHLSKLALVDPRDGGATRVGFRFEDGVKVRYAKKSGEKIDG